MCFPIKFVNDNGALKRESESLAPKAARAIPGGRGKPTGVKGWVERPDRAAQPRSDD